MVIGAGVGGEEEVFEPPDVAIVADLLVPIAEGVGWAGLGLDGEGEGEESESFGFEVADEVGGDAVVDDFEEAEVLAGSDELSFGVRLGEVDEGDECSSVVRFGQLFHCWRFGVDYHCWWW